MQGWLWRGTTVVIPKSILILWKPSSQIVITTAHVGVVELGTF